MQDQDIDIIECNREYYRASAARYDCEEQPFIHQGAFVEALLARLECHSQNARILDFGSGTGSSTQTVVKRFPSAQVVGLDVSREMLAIASQKCPTASFRAFDGRQIPFDADWFDGVLVSSVLHHIRDYELAVVEIARVCRANSWILITQEPNPRIIKYVNMVRRLSGRHVPELVRRAEYHQFSQNGGISPYEIVNMLRTHGFSCEVIYNNDVLLDCLLKDHRVLYRCLRRPSCLRLLPFHVSYNVLARRGPKKRAEVSGTTDTGRPRR